MLDKVQDFTIGWWNTGVHPIKGISKVEKAQVYAYLSKLLEYCDLLALCEQRVDTALYTLIEDWNKSLCASNRSKFEILDLYDQQGKCQFKTVLIWRSSRIQLPQRQAESYYKLDVSTHTDNYRVGQCMMLNLDRVLSVALCLVHWSQHSAHFGEQLKEYAAQKLYREFLCTEPPFKMLVGDFNTEPYSLAMSQLNVSRSARYAQAQGSLWNPFWSLLPEEGTINSPNTKELKCLAPLFDQAIVSSNFLEQFDIQPRIIKEYTPPRNEHFPIVLQFTRKESHEHG